MKKMLFSMIVGIASLGMGAATSQAGTFGLFVCGGCGGCGECGGCGHCHLFHHCCSKCCSTICIKDYNAFSPSFCGNMTFNGCNPFCGGNGCGPSIQAVPSCGGCAAEGGDPVAVPGPSAQAMPYGGPIQAAAMAQQYPQSVMPIAVQPNYWTAGYGR